MTKSTPTIPWDIKAIHVDQPQQSIGCFLCPPSTPTTAQIYFINGTSYCCAHAQEHTQK